MIVIGINTLDSQKTEQELHDYFNSTGKKFPYKVLPNLTFNKGWHAIVVLDFDIELQEELIEFLSKRLDTKVLGFENIDVVTSYKIYLYEKGELIDAFDTVDFVITSTFGYFSFLEDSEDFSPFEPIDEYFEKLGFDPTASEILTQIE